MYALLFRDHGLSAGAISSLLVIWSATSFLLEVPSGAWADTLDRRLLLVLSAAVYAVSFSVMMLWPSYPGFALAFVLWGASSAMMSGTFQALLYDELSAQGATASYAGLLGLAESLALVADLVATLLCGPLFAWGGYELVGWTSVGIAVIHGLLAWSLPRAPKVESAREVPPGHLLTRYVAMLRTGLAEATRQPRVRRLVLVVAAFGLLAYDEYLGLLAGDQGVRTSMVPWLMALVVGGQVLGTALAGRTAALSGRKLGWLVALAAVATSVGALTGHPAGFLGIALGYGVAGNVWIVAEARLQDAIEGPARATVTSVSGLSMEVSALGVFAVVGIGSAWLSLSTLIAVLGLPMLATAWAARRWLPDADPEVLIGSPHGDS